MTTQEVYYILAAIAVLVGFVFKAGQRLESIHKDLQELTKDVSALSTLPARVAALESEVIRIVEHLPARGRRR